MIGKVSIVDKFNNLKCKFGGTNINFNKMKYYNVIPHQSTFVRRIFFNNNLFCENLKFSMDYEFYWRNKKKIKINLIDDVICIIKQGGISEQNFINLFKEYVLIQKKYNINNLFLIKLNYVYRILKFLIKKILIIVRLKT